MAVEIQIDHPVRSGPAVQEERLGSVIRRGGGGPDAFGDLAFLRTLGVRTIVAFDRACIEKPAILIHPQRWIGPEHSAKLLRRSAVIRGDFRQPPAQRHDGPFAACLGGQVDAGGKSRLGRMPAGRGFRAQPRRQSRQHGTRDEEDGFHGHESGG